MPELSAVYAVRRADLTRQRNEAQSRVLKRELANAITVTDVRFLTYLAFVETIVAQQRASNARLRHRNRLFKRLSDSLTKLQKQSSDFGIATGITLGAASLQHDGVIGRLDHWTHTTFALCAHVVEESTLRVMHLPTVNLGSAALDVLWNDVIKDTSKRVADAATLWILAVLKRARKQLPSVKASDDYHVQLTNYMKAVESVMYATEELRQGILGGIQNRKGIERRVTSAIKDRIVAAVAP